MDQFPGEYGSPLTATWRDATLGRAYLQAQVVLLVLLALACLMR